MLKKTIKYTDFDGNERSEDFYFNLTKAELVEMEFSAQGGLANFVKRIVEANDTPKIIPIFKELILKSYGEKSLDGKRFVKNQEMRDAFEQSAAYPELFMELATNSEAATAFVNGIVPQTK